MDHVDDHAACHEDTNRSDDPRQVDIPSQLVQSRDVTLHHRLVAKHLRVHRRSLYVEHEPAEITSDIHGNVRPMALWDL